MCGRNETFGLNFFYSKLTWEPHIRNLKIKCMKAVDILKVLSHTKWGADRKHLLQRHNSLVVLKLSYGSEIYSSATKPRLNALDAVHHAGIRIATGAFRSSLTQSLLVDAGVLPLELIRQSHIIKYWVRSQRLPSFLSYSVIFNENNPQFFETKPLYPKPFSVRVRIILEELEISKGKVLPVRYSAFPPWKLPSVEYCICLADLKRTVQMVLLENIFLII